MLEDIEEKNDALSEKIQHIRKYKIPSRKQNVYELPTGDQLHPYY